MKLGIGLIVLSAFFVCRNAKAYENPVSYFIIADTIRAEIVPNYDSDGLLENYHARIYTPVCEVDKCYAIEIFFYWDLIGRFHHYDTIAGYGLTKLDHQPFTDSDFIKLNDILKNTDSPLASYSKEELVQNTRVSEIDGFTGATIKDIQESVIGGAVYSCHTLWHIAHGAAVDSIQNITKKCWKKELVKKLVHLQDQQINYFLIGSFSETDFEKYLPEVLETLRQTEGYYAKNAIEKMPEKVVSENFAQNFFASIFSQLNYFAQVALLKKLNSSHLSEELAHTLREELDQRGSYKNELIQRLLGEE